MLDLILGSIVGLVVTVALVAVLPARWSHLRAVAAACIGFGVAVVITVLM